MKKILLTLIVCVFMAMMFSGCTCTALKKAHASYVKTMGPPLIEYSKKDPNLNPKILEARIRLHEAAMKVINTGEKTK